MNLLIISPKKKIHLFHNKQGYIETSMVDTIPTKDKTLYLLRSEKITFRGFIYNLSDYEILVNVEWPSETSKRRNFNLRFYEKIEPRSWFCLPIVKSGIRPVKIKSIVENLNKTLGGV